MKTFSPSKSKPWLETIRISFTHFILSNSMANTEDEGCFFLPNYYLVQQAFVLLLLVFLHFVAELVL